MLWWIPIGRRRTRRRRRRLRWILRLNRLLLLPRLHLSSLIVVDLPQQIVAGKAPHETHTRNVPLVIFVRIAFLWRRGVPLIFDENVSLFENVCGGQEIAKGGLLAVVGSFLAVLEGKGVERWLAVVLLSSAAIGIFVDETAPGSEHLPGITTDPAFQAGLV